MGSNPSHLLISFLLYYTVNIEEDSLKITFVSIILQKADNSFFSDGDCQDKPAYVSKCPSWAAQFCGHSFWGSWMASNCKKSCNKCDGNVYLELLCPLRWISR